MVFLCVLCAILANFAVKSFNRKDRQEFAKFAKKIQPEGAGGNARASRLREKPLERKQLPGFSRLSVPFHLTSKQRPNTVPLTDKFGRAITDLRISVTDRCNYKCVYCRTGNEGALYGDLPFADYLRMARVLVGLGSRKGPHHGRRAAAAQRA